jgi:hypothetical protein
MESRRQKDSTAYMRGDTVDVGRFCILTCDPASRKRVEHFPTLRALRVLIRSMLLL